MVRLITVTDVGLQYGGQKLFDHVNLKFTPGNCYGVIGANGAGKSTFLKILSGEIEPNSGSVEIPENTRMSVLKQDHFQYDSFPVMDTVIMGNPRLYEIMKEKEAPVNQLIDQKKVEKFLESPKDYGKPWYGQLMAGPQMIAYLLQINYWLEHYQIRLEL